MAFRELTLRQGTDAQRLTVVLKDGEPWWTTDTDLLYVGDGSTAGGVAVGSGGGGGGSTDILAVAKNIDQVINTVDGWSQLTFETLVKRDSASFGWSGNVVTFNFNGWVRVHYSVSADNPV